MCDKKGNSFFCRLGCCATKWENAEYCLLFPMKILYFLVYCVAIYLEKLAKKQQSSR